MTALATLQDLRKYGIDVPDNTVALTFPSSNQP